jgi:hypothetical protein
MTVSLRHLLSRATLVLACAVLFTHSRATVAGAADAGAEPGLVSVSGEVDGVSRYVWRTLAYSEGAVVQPSVTLTVGTVELNAWANVDPSLVGSGRLTELDFSVAWNLDLGLIEVIPSVMLYTYPQFGEANTGEVQLELRRGMPGSLSAFVRHSTDVLDYPGASFTFVATVQRCLSARRPGSERRRPRGELDASHGPGLGRAPARGLARGGGRASARPAARAHAGHLRHRARPALTRSER